MKKLFLGLILFLSNVSLIRAETFYSSYSDYSAYTDQAITASDTVSVKKERRYKWYKDNKILGDYHPLASVVPDYPEVDTEDYYETKFSDWSKENPGFKYYRVVETRNIYEYKDPLPIRYIHFFNLHGSAEYLYLSELEIYASGQKIDYSSDYDANFITKLKNNVFDGDNKIDSKSQFTIDLNDYYNVKDIVIKLYLYDTTKEKIYINLKFTNESDFNSYIFAVVSYVHRLNNSDLNSLLPIIYQDGNFGYRTPQYGEVKYSLEYPEKIAGRVINEVTQYRYKDTLFRYYKINRDYLVDYYKDNPGDYTKDSEQYKDYYCYKKRDKVVIDDNLLFTDYERKVEDLVLETTNNNIKIDTNLDINKNGQYKVKFILPFMTIEKVVKVDILQNEINATNEKLLAIEKQLKAEKNNLIKSKEELLKLNQELESSNEIDEEKVKDYETKVLALEDNIKNLIEKINQLDQRRIKYNNKLKELLKKKDEQTLVKPNYDYDIFANLKLWLWLLILLILILLILKIIKTKKLSY